MDVRLKKRQLVEKKGCFRFLCAFGTWLGGGGGMHLHVCLLYDERVYTFFSHVRMIRAYTWLYIGVDGHLCMCVCVNERDCMGIGACPDTWLFP